MMNSMTGYGSSQYRSSIFQMEVQIKTVNSRYLDCQWKLARCYLDQEPVLRSAIKKKFSRGRVEVFISRTPEHPPSKLHLKWDPSHAKRWEKLYKDMARKLSLKNDVSLSHMSSLPGVVQSQSIRSAISPKEKEVLRRIFKKALDQCSKERTREGKALKKDILGKWRQLSFKCRRIKACADKQIKEIQKAGKKLSNYDSSPSLTDVSEEIVRLKEHLDHFKNLLKKKVFGKKLDFYLQELLREINTVGSKSQSTLMTSLVVESKHLVEQIKEQVQNIE